MNGCQGFTVPVDYEIAKNILCSADKNNMGWTRLAMLLGCGALACYAGTQAEPLSGYAVDVWKSDKGLPQNTAAAITQSPDGFLWIGTQGGLARFDGLSFKILTRQNSPGLIDTEVRHLLAASDGRLSHPRDGAGLAEAGLD